MGPQSDAAHRAFPDPPPWVSCTLSHTVTCPGRHHAVAGAGFIQGDGALAGRRILILFAHPSLDRSEANRPLAAAIAPLEGVTLVDLYAEYPTFEINVDREQARLLSHEVICFMHPLYWYSTPAILKEWQDLVLEHGFAYGIGAAP